MKKFYFTNLVETKVCAELPTDWPDKPEAAICPDGWMLLMDAENNVVAMMPGEIAFMTMHLFNEIETTNQWEPVE